MFTCLDHLFCWSCCFCPRKLWWVDYHCLCYLWLSPLLARPCQCILVATVVCSWNAAEMMRQVQWKDRVLWTLFFLVYYFSIWHIRPSSVKLSAVCRDYLGRHRAYLGARATLRSLPCAGEPEESVGCGQTHSRASRARLQSQSTAAQEIFLYHSPCHWNSFVHLSSRTEKHFLMLPKGLHKRKLS